MDAINWHSVFFLFFALTACLFAVAVAAAADIVRMACYLIVSLSSVAGLFLLAGAEFVGAMQLMIYVGGTLVLLVFGVMLTAKGVGDELRTSGGQWILAVAAGGSLLAILVQAAASVYIPAEQNEQNVAVAAQAADVPGDGVSTLGLGFLGVRSDSLHEQNPIISQGMSGYLLPFEIVSVHLLVVLIGAAYLARPKARAQTNNTK